MASQGRARRVKAKRARPAADPIPAGDIIEGHPRARTHVLYAAPDGSYTSGVWHCTPGKFHWTFTGHETMYLWEGRAKVTLESGQTVVVEQGDLAHFAPGKTVWHITKTIRKVFVIAAGPSKG